MEDESGGKRALRLSKNRRTFGDAAVVMRVDYAAWEFQEHRVRACVYLACSNHEAREGCAVTPKFSVFYVSSILRNNDGIGKARSTECLRCKCIGNNCRLADVISCVCFDTG